MILNLTPLIVSYPPRYYCRVIAAHELTKYPPKTNSTGASRVFAFDHRVRRGPSDWHEIPVYNVRHRGPLHRAHVDQSYAGAEMVLREKVPNPDEVGRLMQRRWGIVNVG